MHTNISLTTNLEGGLQLQQDGLAEEDLPGLQAQSTDLILLQLHILARLCPPDCSMRAQTASATTMAERCSRYCWLEHYLTICCVCVRMCVCVWYQW